MQFILCKRENQLLKHRYFKRLRQFVEVSGVLEINHLVIVQRLEEIGVVICTHF